MSYPGERPLGFKPDVPSYRELRSQERRQEILEAAARLFREKGYHAVTIEEIAHSLKMTKGSLYHYIHGKEDLLYECNRAANAAFMREAEAILAAPLPPDEKLRCLLTIHLSMLIDDPCTAALILYHLDAIPEPVRTSIVEVRNAIDGVYKQILREGMEAGIFIQDSPTLLTYFLLGACNQIPRWYRPEGTMSKEEIVQFFVKMCLRATLVTPPAWKK